MWTLSGGFFVREILAEAAVTGCGLKDVF